MTGLRLSGLDMVAVFFTEDVNIRVENMALSGAHHGPYVITADRFGYDAENSAATWTLAESIQEESLLLFVADTVTDLAGNFLDGEWIDGQSQFPSGDGVMGGVFEMSFTIWENEPPVIASLTVSPDPVARPAAVTLVAAGVSDPDGDVVAVTFYRDSNGDGQWDEGDEVLGTGVEGGDGWSWTGGTEGWTLGEHTIFARALDDGGAWSEAASVLVTVTSWQNPDNPFDVSGNGSVEAYDVLLLINRINYNGSGVLPPRMADDQHLPYYDVNGDGLLTPLDALMVITHINMQDNPPANPPADGEAVVQAGAGGWWASTSVVEKPEQREPAPWNPQVEDPPRVDVLAVPIPPRDDFHWDLDLEEQSSDEDWETLLGDLTPDLADLDAWFASLD
jgi:hypothetical protein